MHIILGNMLHDIEIYILLTRLLNGSDSCNFLGVLKPKTLLIFKISKAHSTYLEFCFNIPPFISPHVMIIESSAAVNICEVCLGLQ